MPRELRPFFALPAVDLRRVIPNHPLCGQRHESVLMLHPAMKVVPMGWNWAMFIAQRVHQHQSMLAAGLTMDRILVDGRPSPSIADDVAIIPYADNLNIVGCDQHKVQATKQIIVRHMESLGFRIHEEQEALDQAESLGFFIDGRVGRVYPKPNKLQKVRKVLNWLAQRPRVSGKMLERIIGHCIHFCMLRRELLSVFRAVYDFKIIAYNNRQRLWKTAALECKCMASLLDLCFADLRRPWCQEVTASDASLTGTAVCSTHWGPADTHQVGRQRELWRYRAIGGAGRARDHVQALDPFTDHETVLPVSPIPSTSQPLDSFQLNLDFKEVPSTLLRVEDWTIDFSARMTMPEHITLLEGRGVVQALRHKARGSGNFGQRHIHLNDNLGMTLAFDRGRAKNKALLFQCRRSAALAIATHCEFHFRWIPSELNVADKPSRIFEPPRHASKRSTQRAIQEAIDPGSKIKTDKTRNQTGLRGQSFEESCASICGVVQNPHSGRSSAENCRSNGRGSQCKTSETGRRAVKASASRTDLSGAVSNFSQDSRRLSDEGCGVSKVLPVTQHFNNRNKEPGCLFDNLLSAVFQRWHGICRGFKVFGSSHRQLARSSCKGQTTEGSQVVERLEEPRSGKKSSANSLSTGGVDSNEHARGRKCGQCNVGADHVCGLFKANRDPSATKEGSCFVNIVGCDVHARPQQRRGLRDFQDGGGRREPQHRLQGSTVASESTGHVEQKPPSNTKAVSSRVQQFSGRLEASPSEVQPAERTLHSLPAAPRRRQLGPLQRLQNTAGGKDERSLAVRQFDEPIREESIGFNRLRLTPSAGSKALQCSGADAAQQGPQHSGPIKGCHGYALELFAVSARLSKALSKLNWHVEAWDINFSSACDLSKVSIVNNLIDRIKSGAIHFVHFGLPCNTWSRARRNDGRGPGPLRDDAAFLMGFPHLSAVDLHKVKLGNVLLLHTVRLIRACQQAQVCWTLENPKTSRVWLTRQLRRLKNCHFTHVDFCQYNLPWRKSTRFLCCDQLNFTLRCCSGPRGICSRTRAPHLVLAGTHNGQFLTKLAEPYPWAMVRTIATAIHKQTRKSSG